MGTSRSSDPAGRWVAGASIFSGRRDPEWELPPRAGVELAKALADAPPSGGPESEAPPLGYRGVWLREPSGREWWIYGGLVRSASAGAVEYRLDVGRILERRLFATAPPGTLPEGLLG